MKDASKLPPLQARVPDELRQYLKHAAVANRRSLNSEVVVRLEESRRRDQVGGVVTEVVAHVAGQISQNSGPVWAALRDGSNVEPRL